MFAIIFILLIYLLDGILAKRVSALFTPFLIAYIILFVLAALVGTYANIKIFEKAGQNKAFAVIPIANLATMYKMYWGGYWFFGITVFCFLNVLLGFVFPWVIFLLVINAVTAKKQATAFGLGIPYVVGLFFASPIVSLVIAYGDHEYTGVPQDGWTQKDIGFKIRIALDVLGMHK